MENMDVYVTDSAIKREDIYILDKIAKHTKLVIRIKQTEYCLRFNDIAPAKRYSVTTFFIVCLGMRQFLRKCLEAGDIRLPTKDQIAVFHIYVQKWMFNG